MEQERYDSTYSLLLTRGIRTSNQDLYGPQTWLRRFGAEEILLFWSGIELIGYYYLWSVTLGQVLKLLC